MTSARAGRFICCLMLLIAGHGCRPEQPRTVVARVGTAELALEDVQARLARDGGPIPDDQIRRYVDHWVTDELFYQEARRRGMENNEEFEARLDNTRRRLLIQAFLDYQIDQDTAQPTDSTLRAYYDLHTGEFTVQDEMQRMNAIRFDTRERASWFASLVTRGVSWNDAVTAAMKDSQSGAAILNGISGQYMSRHSLYPPELWKVGASLALNEVSFPVNTPAGYCVVQPTGRLTAGSHADFAAARDEVRRRVLVVRRQQLYDDLLGTLRKRYSVDIVLHLNQPSDTLHGIHE